jgi:polyisoprenyl-phosphate glycosyltransferase
MTSTHADISVVAPVYGCAGCVAELCARVIKAIEPLGLTVEIILVDDASPDRAWEAIKSLCAADPRIKGLRFSRNYGQHHAITAGLDHASARWYIVMDCDLQDRPEEIPALVNKAREGFDLVLARRLQRRDSALKKQASRLFYWLFDALSGHAHDPAIGNFGIYSDEVIRVVRSFREQTRYFPFFIKWSGFQAARVDVTHGTRTDGKSAYTLIKQLRHATNIIVAFSPRPLHISITLGLILSTLSMLFAAGLVFRYVTHGVAVEGWTSVMVALSFFSGLIFLNLGMLGVYLGRVFEEVKMRPIYSVMEALNIETSPVPPPQGRVFR